ncbi:MAG: WG repeat-containing protein [Clostridia bacterium]|nr:WG repeat-containing protein [Clostridia bacterium]
MKRYHFISDEIVDNRRAVMLNEKWGFVNEAFIEVIPPTYDCVSEFKGGIAKVLQDGLPYIIDTDGNKKSITGFEKKIINSQFKKVCFLNKWALYDPFDKPLSFYIYDNIEDVSFGFFVVKIKENYGVIDIYGNEIIPVTYDSIRIHKDYFSARVNGKCGIINKKGQIVVPIIYDYIEEIKDGTAIVNISSHRGIFKLTKKR